MKIKRSLASAFIYLIQAAAMISLVIIAGLGKVYNWLANNGDD